MLKHLAIILIVFTTCVVNIANAQEEMIVRIYPIQDLEYTVKNFTNAPRLQLNNALQQQNNLLQNDKKQRIKKVRNYQQIIDIIQKCIEPDVWLEGATITYFRGSLVIRAPKKVHDQL